MAEKISGVYKITNTITKDFYIGSSKDIKRRWRDHKKISLWDRCPNNPLYKDMKKYGTDKFEMQILEEVEVEQLREKEQQFIELLKPTYNSNNAKGLDVYRKKEYQKEYQKEYHKEYQKSDKQREYHNKYYNQLCRYNGETLTLCALSMRFKKYGVEHPVVEAKKYLVL